MLEIVGNLIVWLGALLLPAAATAPIAYLAFKQNRFAFAAAWFALTVGIVAAGYAFSHFAVDLPAFRWRPTLAAWAGGVAAIIAAAAFIADPERLMRGTAAALSAANQKIARLATWLVLSMAVVQFLVVILRYVFGVNFIWMQESVTYMHGAVFLLAGGYALLTDDHVRVDIFYRDAPAKRRALVDFVGAHLFLFPFCLLLLWAGAPYIAQSWSVSEGSTEQSGLQAVFLLKTLIPIFAALLAGAGFVIAARAADI
ncbi:MAG: TRAP transporter small permease subunit, partial [Pseudomonadota bacterium]